MTAFLRSRPFTDALRASAISVVLFPILLAGVDWVLGRAPYSLELVLSYIWPQAVIYGVVFAGLQVALAWQKHRKGGDGTKEAGDV